MNILTDLSNGLRTFLISTVKTVIKNAPVSSNVGFSILLFIAEKIVEMEFICPCGADNRVHFLVLLFIIPGLVGFVLMTTIQRSGFCDCECFLSCLKTFCVCIFPITVWLTLLLLDGRYYICIRTDWLGQYVTVNHSVLEKWCEPDDRTLYKESLKKSYQWYTSSQIGGFYLIGILAMLAFIIIKVKSQPSNSGGPASAAEGNINVQNVQNSGGNVNVDAQRPSTSERKNSPTATSNSN